MHTKFNKMNTNTLYHPLLGSYLSSCNYISSSITGLFQQNPIKNSFHCSLLNLFNLEKYFQNLCTLHSIDVDLVNRPDCLIDCPTFQIHQPWDDRPQNSLNPCAPMCVFIGVVDDCMSIWVVSECMTHTH